MSVLGYLCGSPLKVLHVGVLNLPVLSVKHVIFVDPRVTILPAVHLSIAFYIPALQLSLLSLYLAWYRPIISSTIILRVAFLHS